VRGIRQPVNEGVACATESAFSPSEDALCQHIGVGCGRVKLKQRHVNPCITKFGVHATQQFPLDVRRDFGCAVPSILEAFLKSTGCTAKDNDGIGCKQMAEVAFDQAPAFHTVHVNGEASDVDRMSAVVFGSTKGATGRC
tara:strand:+ start:2259 stop:2678 length:420 start_codon:yes stop_codon:yes gene_type:complete